MEVIATSSNLYNLGLYEVFCIDVRHLRYVEKDKLFCFFNGLKLWAM